MDENGDYRLGREGLIEFVQSLPNDSASSTCQALVERATKTGRIPNDDISLVVIKLTGS